MSFRAELFGPQSFPSSRDTLPSQGKIFSEGISIKVDFGSFFTNAFARAVLFGISGLPFHLLLVVSALGENIEQSIANAYRGVKEITFEGAFYRKDIGKKALKK